MLENQIKMQSNSTAATPPSLTPNKTISTSKLTLIYMLILFVIGTLIVLWAWGIGPFNSKIIQTDNSYVKGKTTILSSQINGHIKDVFVKDFDHVKKGQILMNIDATTYVQKIMQATSGVEQAKNNLTNQSQVIAQRQADVISTQARLGQVKSQYDLSILQLKRYSHLGNSGATSRSEQDKIVADVKNNLAQLEQAKANILVAQEALKAAKIAEIGLKAQIKNAQAHLEEANIDKSFSTIVAPFDGQLGEVNPRIGQYVAVGTQLLYLIPDQIWVIANFKETQIANIKIGQKAFFTVDAMKGQKFTGHVEQISPASGSEFSLLKPDNASGNFTKVVQRISVRIAIDPNQKDIENLRPGISVITAVDTSD